MRPGEGRGGSVEGEGVLGVTLQVWGGGGGGDEGVLAAVCGQAHCGVPQGSTSVTGLVASLQTRRL